MSQISIKPSIALGLSTVFFVLASFIPKTIYAEAKDTFLRDACPNNVCNTAIGDINISSDGSAIADILRLIVGIGGAIAFLLMIYGVYILTTSAGIPDKVNAGKEIISSAVFGLLFIILSLVVFRIIGINILAIPGIS